MKLRTCILVSTALLLSSASMAEGDLFVGLEGGTPNTMFTDLSGFPNVTWTQYYSFDVSGATATPEDTLYLCNGAFNTDLYKATLDMTPVFLADISEDMSSLAYGRDTLWGFSNYASIKGIYSINIQTGVATLAIDTYTGTGFRFFALGYNPVDDMLYGYTEYGSSGLYSIDIDSGDMVKIAETIPASNGQGRGLAVGNNVVYLTATRGDDDIPYYAYDLSQGTGGVWEEFTNPYPTYHSTGAAAWLSGYTGMEEENNAAAGGNNMNLSISPNPVSGLTTFSFELSLSGNASLNIYDASGRIRTAVMNTDFEAGQYDVVWDSNLPSGVYLAVLKRGSQTAAQRLILIR